MQKDCRALSFCISSRAHVYLNVYVCVFCLSELAPHAYELTQTSHHVLCKRLRAKRKRKGKQKSAVNIIVVVAVVVSIIIIIKK